MTIASDLETARRAFYDTFAVTGPSGIARYGIPWPPSATEQTYTTAARAALNANVAILDTEGPFFDKAAEAQAASIDAALAAGQARDDIIAMEAVDSAALDAAVAADVASQPLTYHGDVYSATLTSLAALSSAAAASLQSASTLADTADTKLGDRLAAFDALAAVLLVSYGTFMPAAPSATGSVGTIGVTLLRSLSLTAEAATGAVGDIAPQVT